MSSKMWGGRFSEVPSKFVEEFGAVINVETRLCPYDIQGSLAHVTMLGETGILNAEDVKAIQDGLKVVAKEIEDGKFTFKAEDEDIHMAIEKRLIELIGPAGGRLHTGRSRNDQCCVDSYLYFRDAAKQCQELILEIQKAIFKQAEENFGKIMPGFTHLQTAQPVLVSHWIMAYFWMLKRDYDRLQGFLDRLCECPLGAAALAGTDFPIDRWSTAKQLGFKKPTENSIDSVADRDYCIEFGSIAATSYMHLSRLCEEIIIFSSQEYKFLELSDDFTTGSSIMPQKKNCDFAELIKGRTGRMYGYLMAMLTMMKGIPLAYDKDMQEDKFLSYQLIDMWQDTMKVMAPMIRKMRVNTEKTYAAASNGYSTATDMADYLVRKGMPFRDAHRVVGQTVRYCVEHQKTFNELTLEEFKQQCELFEEDIYEEISLEHSVGARNSYGGTSPEAVKVQMQNAEAFLDEAHSK
ncbi:MAG: argininosuccinate lyase [Candidatus Aphodousia sp.]|nr:argininosuccinate lyase [Sutterella sp.]MDY2899669.1 argininosuccinate lyase [Candidatus Aphodousia sp.]